MFSKIYISFLFLVGIFSTLNAQNILDSTQNESFPSLKERLEKTSTITSLQKVTYSKTPGALTVITREDIQNTPARNLLDLIELYVPSMQWMNSGGGTVLGIRGTVGGRKNYFTLLLNGINISQKTGNGAVTELENWNMDDIERIEVVRSPNAAVQGQGSLVGSINIVLKDSNSFQGTTVRTHYTGGYNSKGLSLQHAAKNEDFEVYFYGSATQTKGLTPDVFATQFSFKPEIGFIGQDFTSPGVLFQQVADRIGITSFEEFQGNDIASAFPNYGGLAPLVLGAEGLSANPFSYFRDYDDIPQIKMYTNLRFRKDWLFSARYTQSGTTPQTLRLTQTRPLDGFRLDSVTTDANGFPEYWHSPSLGDAEDLFGYRNRQFTLALQNEHTFENGLFLRSRVSYYAMDTDLRFYSYYYHAYDTPDYVANILQDKNNPIYKSQNFAENELALNLTATVPLAENYHLSFGAEVLSNTVTKGWGDNQNDLRAGTFNNIFANERATAYELRAYTEYQEDSTFFVGDGWTNTTYSAFAEANLAFTSQFQVLLNARVDKHTFSNWIVSPRLMLLSEIDSKNTLRLIAQQSNRLQPNQDLYLENLQGIVSSPQTLLQGELMYTRMQGENFFLQTSLYYKQVAMPYYAQEVLPLTFGEIEYTTGTINQYQTDFFEESQFVGAEVEIVYQDKNFSLGTHYAYSQQLNTPERLLGDVNANFDLLNEPGEDFFGKMGMRVYLQTFNNLANQSAKLWGNYKFLNNRLQVHANIKAFWDYERAKESIYHGVNDILDSESLDLFFLGYDPEQIEAEVQTFRDAFKDINIYGFNARMDLSVSLQMTDQINVAVFAFNVLNFTNNRRYTYTGEEQLAPLEVYSDGELGNLFDQLWGFNLASFITSQTHSFIEEPRVFGAKVQIDF